MRTPYHFVVIVFLFFWFNLSIAQYAVGQKDYADKSGNGKIDTLQLIWNGKKVVVVDEDECFLHTWQAKGFEPEAQLNRAFSVGVEPPVVWNPLRAGWGSYIIVGDGDGDGVFNSNRDFYYRIVDLNHDRLPEIEYFGVAAGKENVIEMLVNLNGERDFKYLDFKNFLLANEQRFAPGKKLYCNVSGSGFFHNSRLDWPDLSIAWENPIAWYDFNHDGYTDMAMRITTLQQNKFVHEAEFAYVLNDDLGPDNWQSLDCQFTLVTYKAGPEPAVVHPGLAMDDFVDDIAVLAAPEYLRPLLGERFQKMAYSVEKIYLPLMDGYKLATDYSGWRGAWLLWDEDNDDTRWEEMFSRKEVAPPADWQAIADKIGDRVEVDSDFVGKGKYYVGPFDGKIHLYKANDSDWNVDYYGHYRQMIGQPMPGVPVPDGLLHDLIKYYDRDKNGFIDRIDYGSAAFGHEAETFKVERSVNLLDYADNENPHPDVAPLFDLRVKADNTHWKVSNWDGEPFEDWSGTSIYQGYQKVKVLYHKLCAAQWHEARMLYDTAVYLGLNTSQSLSECAAAKELDEQEKKELKDIRMLRGYDAITTATSLWQKHHHGYWLKEKVLLDILDQVDEQTAAEVRRLYYTDRISELCVFLMNCFTAIP